MPLGMLILPLALRYFSYKLPLDPMGTDAS